MITEKMKNIVFHMKKMDKLSVQLDKIYNNLISNL
jgi:hypothetical protein